MGGQFITHRDAAGISGLSTSSVRRLLDARIIASEYVWDGNGRVRKIRRATVEAWVAAGCPRPKPGRPGRNGKRLYDALIRGN